jgi:hypothetical protein
MAIRTYKFYANLVVGVHFGWTLLLIGGAIAMFFSPWFAIAEMMILAFTLLIALPFGRTCPLTLFEEKLRKKIDPSYRNDGSYITVYLNKFLKTRFTPSRVSRVIGGLYTITVALALAILIVANGGI